MSNIKFNLRNLTVLVLILVVGIFRALIPIMGDVYTLANYSAVGAVALFAGAYFSSGSKSFGVPLLVMFVSDVILSLTIYKSANPGFLYEGWYLVYAAVILMVLVGKIMLKNTSVLSVAAASLVAVLIHWIVTDLGVWYGSPFYAQTLSGFWIVLVNAIPFEMRFLYGTMAYSAVLFGVFEYLKSKYPVLKAKSNAVALN